jgi:hypothetical protein
LGNTEVKFKVFGKANCPICHKVREKMEYFRNHWLSCALIEYYDMETVLGLTEGAFNDITEIPSVVLEKDGKELGRWIKTAPTFEELKTIFAIPNEKPVK